MGIYIKSIGIPTDNTVLIRVFPVSENGEYYVQQLDVDGDILDELWGVPVPPHGRLGDLDKLVEKIDGIWDCNDMVFKPNDHCCNVPEDCKGCKWAQTKDYIQRMVENAPTIIEAEEG